ncbi:hypothetical protein BaRGS_00005845 [Batillaria attramentaria]|uniref:Uncharacterized protein n=1 Tax=Batillaria attramentaria TaxID=370345 RepID=A0ABD0LUG8_9CAEN
MHRYDVWHVVKGLKKKMLRLSNEKECGLLSSWIRSICNHLYWVAVSTPDGDGDLMESKWLSLTNHIHDVHEHPSHLFPQCQHPHLPEGGRQKKWLTPGTKLSVKLGEVLESRQMLKDVRKLSTGPQTSAIEAYHSVVNHFAPKMIGFHHHGMLCRAQLAALHFNENHEREQATTRDGTARFNLSYRKSKKGFTLQEVKVGCTYEYVAELLDNVLDMASRFSISEVKAYLKAKEEHQAPPPLCSDFENVRPEKAQAIEQYKARFKLV